MFVITSELFSKEPTIRARAQSVCGHPAMSSRCGPRVEDYHSCYTALSNMVAREGEEETLTILPTCKGHRGQILVLPCPVASARWRVYVAMRLLETFNSTGARSYKLCMSRRDALRRIIIPEVDEFPVIAAPAAMRRLRTPMDPNRRASRARTEGELAP